MKDLLDQTPAPWWRTSLSARSVGVLAVPIAALFLALLSIYWVDGEIRDTGRTVWRASTIRTVLVRLRSGLAEAEMALDAYRATKDARFLTAFEDAERAVGDSQSRLMAGITGNETALANQIRLLIASEMDLLDQLRRGADGTAAGRQKAVMTELLARISDFDETEQLRFRTAQGQIALARWRLLYVVILCGALGLLGGLFIYAVGSRRMAERLRTVRENAKRLGGGQPLIPVLPGDRQIDALGREIESAAAILREREREFRESEGRYRHLFDHAPIPYGETDRSGVIRHANQAMLRLMRCAPDQLLGKHFWDYVVPDRQETFRTAMIRRIECGEETGPFDCDYLLDDGTYITVEVREALIRNDAGEVTGTVRSLLDVTERNLAAIAVRKAEQYAMELRIRNEQLARALEAARAATAAKGRFLASVSHELRTPLNGIIGFSELLYDEKLGPMPAEQREVQGDVLASARHLLQLINDILDLSKVESGRMEFHSERHVLRDLLLHVRDVLRPLAEKKALTLNVEAPPDLVAVIDGGRFKQVLYNYLSNAVKFTPNGGRVTARILAEGERFRLEVEDTGIGVAEEDLPRLFQEFSQVSNSRHAEQGTGLGLSLTKHLVEAQGGSVGVRSEPGRGSVFFAELPLEAGASSATA